MLKSEDRCVDGNFHKFKYFETFYGKVKTDEEIPLRKYVFYCIKCLRIESKILISE